MIIKKTCYKFGKKLLKLSTLMDSLIKLGEIIILFKYLKNN